MPIDIPIPVNFWNISDWQRTRQEWQNKGVTSKGQTLLWRIVNRKSVRRTVAAAGWWSLEQDLVAGAGLDSWYKTGSRWIGGRWFRTGICWCRKVVAGSGLVAACICWCRKAVAGSGLVAAGAELVSAGAERWSLLQEGGRWDRAGCCWWRNVVVGAGRWSLLQEGGRRCKKVVAGAGLVVSAAGKWSTVQEGSCWCRLRMY